MRIRHGTLLRIAGRWAAALLLAIQAGAAGAQLRNLDPDSAFFQELRREPLPGEAFEVLVRAALLARTRATDDAAMLANALDRARILSLLGEPVPAPVTIGDAIAGEKAAAEKYDALHRRAMSSQLLIERAAGSKPDSVRHDGQIAYLGNSVWQGGATHRRVWMRVKVTSKSTLPITMFGITIRHPSEPGRRLDFWQCQFEGNAELPPQASGHAVCLDEVDIDKPPAALAAASAPTLALPIVLTRLEMPGYRFIAGVSTLPEDNSRLGRADAAAEGMLHKLPCGRINACTQLAAQTASEAKQRFDTGPEHVEQQRVLRRNAAESRLHTAFALMLALMIGAAAFVPLPDDPDLGRTGTLAALAIVPTGAVVLGGTIPVMLEWPDAQGNGGYLFLIPALGAALLLAILLILLGTLLLTPERRSRPRLAAAGFGIGALGMLASAFLG